VLITEQRELLNENEAAEFLNMSVATLRRHRYGIGNRHGGPPLVKIGHLVRYPREGLRRYVASLERSVIPSRVAA
jgi:hypothetical protein